jgi:hypothetical protein
MYLNEEQTKTKLVEIDFRKFRKMNQPIWSSYEEEKRLTSFIRRFKTEIYTCYELG